MPFHDVVLVPAPWLGRVETIKSSAAQNADAEVRASRLANQIKDLVREVKIRVRSRSADVIQIHALKLYRVAQDQNLQEAGVKIELMEKKVETVRKQVGSLRAAFLNSISLMARHQQAETIVELEGSVSKALAKEKAMQDALDLLQKELDQLEVENAKLRRDVSGERRGKLSRGSSRTKR
jgi:dynactin 1